jgi:hypothetical protein
VYYFEGLKHYAVREPDPSTSKKSRQSQSQQQQPAATRTTSQNLQSTPTAQQPAGSQLSQPAEPAKPAEPAARSGGGPGKEPCDLVTFVSGWLIGREDELLKDKDRITPKQVKVVVTSCDFAAASIMLPLGAVRVKDKTLWAVQWSGWTHEHYSLIDVKDDDLMAAVASGGGGQCPQR